MVIDRPMPRDGAQPSAEDARIVELTEPGPSEEEDLLDLILCVCVGEFVFDVPLRGSLGLLAALAMLFAMANAGLPGTSGFVGEFMVILSAFKANFWIAFFAATTLILGAAYTLWMVKRVVYGPVANDHVAHLTDLNGREFAILAVLAVAVLLVPYDDDDLERLMLARSPSNNILSVQTFSPSSNPKYTRPTGFPGRSPPGPAMPETDTATCA